jgi:tRNA/tmRNA/rRNA uracil-C5-methylase (TrmA/RlmC/RlmD family)
MTHLTAHCCTAEQFFEKSILKPTDCLIVDPPRPGLSKMVRSSIGQVKPKQLLSISCDPATFSRDAGYFINDCGYSLEKIALFDLYPQTHHCEIAAFFAHP